MKRFRAAGIWLWMLTKRLYKKPSFLLILFLIPVLVLGYRSSTDENSGMLSVAIVVDGQDPLSQQLAAELMDSSQLLRCVSCDLNAARELLVAGKADALWHFPEDLPQRVREFSQNPSASNAFIQVLVREDNVALRMSREKISGVLYGPIAQYVYLDRLRQVAPELNSLSDTELLAYYDQSEISGELFTFGEAIADNMSQGHYLLAPLRGMLGIVAVLCALAASMYYIADHRRGTFAWISRHRQPIPELACQLVAVFHIVAGAWLCQSISGLSGPFLTELLTTFLYTLCCAAFAMALRCIFGTVRRMGALLPVLITLMLVICPVFFDLGAMRQLQYLFPPTYYINASSNSLWLLHMLLYTFICFGIYFLISHFPKRD